MPSTLPPLPTSLSTTPQRITATCILILTLLVGVGVITFLGNVVRPVLIAVFLYFIIKPAADWLTRRGLASWLAYLVLSALLIAAIIGLVRVVYHSVEEFQTELPVYREQLSQRFSTIPGFSIERLEGRSIMELLDLKPATSSTTPSARRCTSPKSCCWCSSISCS